jgi:hypothetical protein
MTKVTSIDVDLQHGGRWTSLRGPAGREWLSTRRVALPDREAALPGSAFVDAGGLEECVPTIAGAYDHGDCWARPWNGDAYAASVRGDHFDLDRSISIHGARVVARYRLTAEPGFRFVWAGHASLDLSESAQLVAPAGARTRYWPQHWRTWPDLDQREGPWPAPDGTPLDRLPADGSSVFFMLIDQPELLIEDRARLQFRLDAPGQPIAIAVWRNLGGWPENAPYRGIAIEPAIGWHFDRDLAGEGETGIVGGGGSVEWQLTIEPSE